MYIYMYTHSGEDIELQINIMYVCVQSCGSVPCVRKQVYIYIYIYAYIRMCARVCVCVFM